MNNTATPKKARPEGHLSTSQVLIGLAAGIGAIWFMASEPSSPDDRETTAQATPFMAFVQCQAFVKNTLKAPATAQFPGKPLSAIAAGENTFIVTSTVDAQNGFGAQLRNDWLCKTTYNGGHPADLSSWALDSLSIQ